MKNQASAQPRKRFFREMFTRDIALADCILDLIDNSIDALIRSRNLDVSYNMLFSEGTEKKKDLPIIKLKFNSRAFEIIDTSGGISEDTFKTEVFSFGHLQDVQGSHLGAYGIGLKRALFKIGDHFTLQSRSKRTELKVDVDLVSWCEKDSTMDDWRIPYTIKRLPADVDDCGGTTIRIDKLHQDVSDRFSNDAFETELKRIAGQTYGLILDKYLRLQINGELVAPKTVSFGDGEIKSAKKTLQMGDVQISLYAGVAPRSKTQEWTQEDAGTTIFCNGRVIVLNDKTELTGWGTSLLPVFVPKYRGLQSCMYFHANNPLDLPWSTTKRSINRDSQVFLRAKNELAAISKPVISFLNGFYVGDEVERTEARAVAQQLKVTPINVIAKSQDRAFVVPATQKKIPQDVRINFLAPVRQVDAAKKFFGDRSLTSAKLGRAIFDHFIENECS